MKKLGVTFLIIMFWGFSLSNGYSENSQFGSIVVEETKPVKQNDEEQTKTKSVSKKKKEADKPKKTEVKRQEVLKPQKPPEKIVQQEEKVVPQSKAEAAVPKQNKAASLPGWTIFDEGDTDGPSVWNMLEGKIAQSSGIKGGIEEASDIAKRGTYAIKDGTEYNNYEVTSDLLSKDDNILGIMFGYKNEKNYYRFSIDKNRHLRRLVKNTEGQMKVLAEDNFTYAKNKFYSVKAGVVKNQIKVSFDNKLIFDVSDNAKLKGKAGLYCWNNKDSEFKNFSVTQVKVPGEEDASSKSGNILSAAEVAEMLKIKEELQDLQEEVAQLREESQARKKLEITESEKAKKEEEILKAAGRTYTLLKRGSLGLEYSINYTYFSAENLNVESLKQSTNPTRIVERVANHNIVNAFSIEFPFLDNLTVNADIPFAYKFSKTGSSESLKATDLGDVSMGFQFQPLKTGGKLPTSILFASLSLPTGRSPYDIVPSKALSTGSGYYAASAGLSLSESIDPIMAFGSLSYNHGFDVEDLQQNYSNGDTLLRVSPGDTISISAGIGYSLSYKVSLNLSYQYTYNFASEYYWKKMKSVNNEGSTSSMLNIGTGWVLSPERSIQLKVGIGLTNDDPDFNFSFRLPLVFEFMK